MEHAGTKLNSTDFSDTDDPTEKVKRVSDKNMRKIGTVKPWGFISGDGQRCIHRDGAEYIR